MSIVSSSSFIFSFFFLLSFASSSNLFEKNSSDSVSLICAFLVSSFKTNNSFTWFSIFLKQFTRIFAHSDEFNPSLKISSDKDPVLSAFFFYLLCIFPISLVSQEKFHELLMRQINLITFDKMNIYL